MEPAIFVAIFTAIFVAIFCALIGAFDLSGERRKAARDKRIAEYKMAARLLRLNIWAFLKALLNIPEMVHLKSGRCRLDLGQQFRDVPHAIRDACLPVCIAGVTRKVLWTRQKLYHAKCRLTAAFRLSTFFEKAFVTRVRRRICIRIVKFWRSIWLVEMCSRFGFLGLHFQGRHQLETTLS
jgi:hypothetical protein